MKTNNWINSIFQNVLFLTIGLPGLIILILFPTFAFGDGFFNSISTKNIIIVIVILFIASNMFLVGVGKIRQYIFIVPVIMIPILQFILLYYNHEIIDYKFDIAIPEIVAYIIWQIFKRIYG